MPDHDTQYERATRVGRANHEEIIVFLIQFTHTIRENRIDGRSRGNVATGDYLIF